MNTIKLKITLGTLLFVLGCSDDKESKSSSTTSIFCLTESAEVCNRLDTANPEIWTEDCSDNNGSIVSSCPTEQCVGSWKTSIDENTSQTRFWYLPNFSSESVENACKEGTFSADCS